MANNENLKGQQIEALKENLFTIDWCLKYDKSKALSWTGDSKIGCLGIPATILLCSLIDTIGSVFCHTKTQIKIGKDNYKIQKASDHFYILNHDKFFNLNLSKVTIDDFYSTYRSKLTHNSSLPPNNYLSIVSNTDNIFDLNSKEEITKIYLFPLYEKTKISINTLIYYLTNGTFSPDHKLTNDLESMAKSYDSGVKIRPSDTGTTIDNKIK